MCFDALIVILTKLFTRLTSFRRNKKLARSLANNAAHVRSGLASRVKNWRKEPLPTEIAKRVIVLLLCLRDVDIVVLKHQIMPLGKRVRHAGKHKNRLKTLEEALNLASTQLNDDCLSRDERKIKDSTSAIDIVAALKLLVNKEVQARAGQEHAQVSSDFFNKVSSLVPEEELTSGNSQDAPSEPEYWARESSAPLAALHKQTCGKLRCDDNGNFCGCIHSKQSDDAAETHSEAAETILESIRKDSKDANRSKNQKPIKDHTCGSCKKTFETQTKKRARWQKGFRGFELVFVMTSAVMMLSWVWPRPHGAHKMQPWATRPKKELWLSISAGLATFFALLSFGKQIMSPIGVHANLGQIKWWKAVAWAGGDLLTAFSGIVTIVLIRQHQLFELDLGEPDSTRFLFLSCMYGLDVVYELVFLFMICLGCCACTDCCRTGHSNDKKRQRERAPEDERSLLPNAL